MDIWSKTMGIFHIKVRENLKFFSDKPHQMPETQSKKPPAQAQNLG